MDTILVTGGAGFIGGNFVRDQVLSRGRRVVTLDKLTYAGNRATLAEVEDHEAHHLVIGDIGDRGLVLDLLRRHRPRALVNFAAETHVDRSIDGPAVFLETNVHGVFELLEAVRAYLNAPDMDDAGDFRFIQVSTDEVFGDAAAAGVETFDPDSAYAPTSPYAASKAAADHLVRAWVRTYGVPAIVTHCSNTYGPYQFPEKLVPTVVLNAIAGQPIPIYGDGAQERDWLFVNDHCSAIDMVIEDGLVGETYAIGARARCANLDLVHALCVILDRMSPDTAGEGHARLIEHVADRPGHDRRYAIDPAALERDLGWRGQESLETGLEKTVRWYLDNEAWWRPIRERVYDGRRLGLG